MFNLRALFHKNRAEQDMDDELRFHLDQQIEQNIAQGMSADEARYAALRQFGNVSQLKEECRDSWGYDFSMNSSRTSATACASCAATRLGSGSAARQPHHSHQTWASCNPHCSRPSPSCARNLARSHHPCRIDRGRVSGSRAGASLRAAQTTLALMSSGSKCG